MANRLFWHCWSGHWQCLGPSWMILMGLVAHGNKYSTRAVTEWNRNSASQNNFTLISFQSAGTRQATTTSSSSPTITISWPHHVAPFVYANTRQNLVRKETRRLTSNTPSTKELHTNRHGFLPSSMMMMRMMMMMMKTVKMKLMMIMWCWWRVTSFSPVRIGASCEARHLGS